MKGEKIMEKKDIKGYLELLGIPPSKAGFLEKKYQERVLDMLQNAPNRLLDVLSPSEVRKARVMNIKYLLDPNLYYFLSGAGFEEEDILKAYELFKKINRMENPYVLCEADISFKKVDYLAKESGILEAVCNLEAERFKYAVLEVLKNFWKTTNPEFSSLYGSTCILMEDLYDKMMELTDLEYDRTYFQERVGALFLGGFLSITHMDGKTYVHERKAAAMEGRLARAIRCHREYPEDFILADDATLTRYIELSEAELDIQLSDEQADAVRMAVSSPISVLTGGPGTGKTAVQKVLISTFEWATKCQPVRLIAPTGQAAKRMTESTGYPASTIHSALKIRAGENCLEAECDEELSEGLIVVDEASMVDEELFTLLMEHIGENSRILIVGDVNQLPAIGIGNVLKKLIEANTIPVTRLTRVFRQVKDSPVAHNAARIQAEQLQMIEDQNFLFRIPERGEELSDIICEEYLKSVEADGIDNIVCLTAFRKHTDTGVDILNKRLQMLVHPERKTEKIPYIKRENRTFYEGDKIVFLKNKGNLVNGDIGYVEKVERNTLFCKFGDRTEKLKGEDLYAIDLAYAQTIHKSQGSGATRSLLKR